ncbi:type II toxin-antitoxin system HicB family antitoxin [Planktothrix mougeotii]|uniref:Type II toxin-antitoxin system HicB family antitoxin n=1 Tax=Planktothrix mougeotii LEGE 06226 TaxID=1828728 RepID=A0ABR9UFF4_9CYAN|nr:type II toxin-antitoxin system HicB family antitoxin [Planktothrix mougeotii]MBE9145197.1 type II toxin-antitoxin system HicB family antitoxin [Planktothrix mougeotii LEGE 06226]
MKTFTAIIEKDSDTNLYVGYIPGFPGAHSQGETLDELQENLREVIEMLLEDDDLVIKTEFIGTQQIVIR